MALLLSAMTACSDEAPAPAAEAAATETASTLPAVPAALKHMKFFNATPSTTAQYYIYLQSASWCGPCNREMPRMVEQYKEMKEDDRVEVILVSFDQNAERGQGFLMQYGAPFAGIMNNDPSVVDLPGFTRARGIPMAIIVTAEGKVLFAGHAGHVAAGEWKDIISGQNK